MEANARQIGGNHYKTKFEHWDLIEDYGLGYLEGCATKYISRWRKKDGLRDLEKAVHYVDKLIEKVKHSNRKPRGIVPQAEIVRFSRENELSVAEDHLIFMLCRWENLEMLCLARGRLIDLLEAERAVQPGQGSTGQERPHGFDPKGDV